MFNHVYTCLYMVTYHNKTKLLKLEKWKKYIAKHIALLTFSALPGAFTHPGFPSSHLLFWGLIILNHFQSIPEIDPKDILPKKITERNHKKRDFHMVDILYKFTIKKTRSLVNHRKKNTLFSSLRSAGKEAGALPRSMTSCNDMFRASAWLPLVLGYAHRNMI